MNIDTYNKLRKVATQPVSLNLSKSPEQVLNDVLSSGIEYGEKPVSSAESKILFNEMPDDVKARVRSIDYDLGTEIYAVTLKDGSQVTYDSMFGELGE